MFVYLSGAIRLTVYTIGYALGHWSFWLILALYCCAVLFLVRRPPRLLFLHGIIAALAFSWILMGICDDYSEERSLAVCWAGVFWAISLIPLLIHFARTSAAGETKGEQDHV